MQRPDRFGSFTGSASDLLPGLAGFTHNPPGLIAALRKTVPTQMEMIDAPSWGSGFTLKLCGADHFEAVLRADVDGAG